jgi:small basic protein (TIGR04137 family)
MGIHPSLNRDSKGAAHRSVWKRFERIKHLLEKGKWKEGDSVFGLQKIKSLKFKVKKEKPQAAEEQAAEAATPAAGGEGEQAKQQGAGGESKKEEQKK